MTARKTAADVGSFDAFWAEVSGGGVETIRGIEVTIPTDVPLALEMRIKDLQESESEDDIRELVALLFGADVLDAWRDAGMGSLEFQTVLAWGMGRASGAALTFREAYDTVTAAADDAGKAPNRATRRAAASSKPSAATGGRSKRTSAASTASRRTTSRA